MRHQLDSGSGPVRGHPHVVQEMEMLESFIEAALELTEAFVCLPVKVDDVAIKGASRIAMPDSIG